MTAFSYVGLLSLLWVWLFHAVLLSHFPPSSFLEWLSSEQFAELESIHLLVSSARACSFGLPVFRGFVFSNFQGCFDILIKAFLSLVILLISPVQRAHFSYSSLAYFMGLLLPRFSSFWFCSSSTPYIGLLCLLRMHAINSCVGDAWQRLWRDDFTHNGKQVVNRLKIPQGLSTLMFRRWSEVPSRGGVRGDSP